MLYDLLDMYSVKTWVNGRYLYNKDFPCSMKLIMQLFFFSFASVYTHVPWNGF